MRLAVDRAGFARMVRQTLAHLNDRSYLAVHPLAASLERGRPLTGDQLRSRLVEAVEQLKPVAAAPPSDPAWRRYRHLVLRYVEGLGRDEVAQLLGVSARQASRDHEQAVDAATEVLWLWWSGARVSGRDDASISAGGGDPTGDVAKATAEEDLTADVGETLRGVLATLGKLLAGRRVSFRASVPDTLPTVAVPRPLLRQAVLNLLTYVAEVMPAGEVELVATDTAQGPAIRAVLPAQLDDFAASRPSPLARELLETVGRLVEAHGGRIDVAGGGDGPLLTLILPPVPLKKLLVIDDNPDVVMLFQRYLRGEPYRVIQATSGESALRLAGELRPDVITLDVLLPSEDGWDVLERLRAAPATSDIPVVVCSVLPERALALSLGVTDFLAKPVTRTALLEMLARCLGARPARRDRP